MLYRPLGRSGLTVSAIGFGAWGIGGAVSGGLSYGVTDDAVSVAALAAAFDAGVTLYDTAPLYGLGHSEELIGQVFADKRSQVVLASKAGYADFASGQDFSPAALRHSVEGSLRRLRTSWLDLLQLHDVDPDQLRACPEIVETLVRLREDGKILAFAASVKSPEQASTLLAEGWGFAALQVNFNLLDLRAVECGLLAEAERQGVAIIARTPLGLGFLTGHLTGEESFSADDHRSRWPREKIHAWAKQAAALLALDLDSGDGATTALRFVLSFPAVAATIPGMLSPAHVAENTRAGSLGPLPQGVVDALLARASIAS